MYIKLSNRRVNPSDYIPLIENELRLIRTNRHRHEELCPTLLPFFRLHIKFHLGVSNFRSP